MFGVPPTIAIGVKSLTASYGQLAHGRIGPVRAHVADHQRVAVRRSLRRRHRSDDAAAAALVVDDDRLPERTSQPVGDLARDEVDAAAGLHRCDDLDRLVRVPGLAERRRDHRHRGEGGEG
jgi:hypothetical protein